MAVPVAFCITELDPGGAERALFEVVTRLDPADWTVKVFCLGPETDLSRKLQERGIDTVCLGARRTSDVGVLFRLIRELKKFRPAVLQTFLFHANIAGRLAGWWAGVPVILSGLRVAEKAKRWHLWLDRWTNQLVKWNVCVSEGVRQFAMKDGGLPADKLCVIPNGVDVERFANATPADLTTIGIPEEAWTLVTVGRLSLQKGQDDLIAAVAPLLKEHGDLHILILGEGPERDRLTSMTSNLGIRDQVHFPGWQPDVPGILKSCQVFVLPSRWEGMPNALLEALASGLPCIATNVEGVGELWGSGEAANLVTPGDVTALRIAVKTAYEESQKRRTRSPQHIIPKEHTWEHVALSYEELFASCLK